MGMAYATGIGVHGSARVCTSVWMAVPGEDAAGRSAAVDVPLPITRASIVRCRSIRACQRATVHTSLSSAHFTVQWSFFV